jgi:hypothetical protein
VIALDQVDHGEHNPSSQPGGKILDIWDWILVWNGGVFEKAVITTQPIAAI